MRKMSKKTLIGASLCVLILFVFVAQPVIAATTDIIVESAPSWVDTPNVNGFGTTVSADGYYVENITWEWWGKIASYFELDAKTVPEVTSSNLFLTTAGISVIDMETLEVSTYWFTFGSEYNPEWSCTGDFLAGILLSVLPDTQFKRLAGTDSYDIALAMKQTYNVQTKTVNMLPGLGLFFATSEPALNETTLEFTPASAINMADWNPTYRKETIEGAAISMLDEEISDTEGYEAEANISDTYAHDGYNHTWSSTGTVSTFDDENATSVIDIYGSGAIPTYESVEDALGRNQVEQGTFTVIEDDLEEEITDLMPNVALSSKLGILFATNILNEFINRVRPIIDLPRQFAQTASGAVVKFTNRAMSVASGLATHTVDAVKGGFTSTLKTAASTASGMIFNIGEKVQGLAFKFLGWIPKVISLALPAIIIFIVVLALGLFVVRPYLKRKKIL